MLPASVGATAAKVLVCFFCIMRFVKFPPWGREKQQWQGHSELKCRFSGGPIRSPGYKYPKGKKKKEWLARFSWLLIRMAMCTKPKRYG
jgi:hypothetical protein